MNSVINRLITRCIGLIRNHLNALIRYIESAVTRCTRLTELSIKQIKEIIDIMVVVVKENTWIGRVLLFHQSTVVRLVTLTTTGCANEIKRTFIGLKRTAFQTCLVLASFPSAGSLCCYTYGIRYRTRYYRPGIRINRTNHFVAVVVTLYSKVNLTLLEDRQHHISQQRTLVIRMVTCAREEVLM